MIDIEMEHAEKPTRDDVAYLKYVYTTRHYVYRENLIKDMSLGKIKWLEEHNYIIKKNMIAKCIICDGPVDNPRGNACGDKHKQQIAYLKNLAKNNKKYIPTEYNLLTRNITGSALARFNKIYKTNVEVFNNGR